MGDLISLAVVVAFFVLAVGFVRLCDRIVAADLAYDEVPGVAPDPPDAEPAVSAGPAEAGA